MDEADNLADPTGNDDYCYDPGFSRESQNFNFELKDGSEDMYKIIDDYGYCVTVGNAKSWTRDDTSTYVVGSDLDTNCGYWQYGPTGEEGVFTLIMAVNKVQSSNKYVGWGLAIIPEVDKYLVEK